MSTPIKGIIAIDGPAGSGKSTAARGLAQRLGYVHLDSGAIYRCITYAAIGHAIPLEEGGLIAEMAMRLKIEFMRGTDGKETVHVNGADRTLAIREEPVTRAVPLVARHPQVRDIVDAQLRAHGSEGGVVCDGRDIGISVFPHAHAKFFLEASLEARSNRTGQRPERLAERDRIDRERAVSPLRAAEDAIKVDTTRLTAADTLNILYERTLPLLPR